MYEHDCELPGMRAMPSCDSCIAPFGRGIPYLIVGGQDSPLKQKCYTNSSPSLVHLSLTFMMRGTIWPCGP